MTASTQLFALKRIKDMVCDSFHVDMNELTSARRLKRIYVYRQIAYLLCYELTGVSLMRIGVAFGGRDHTTILHGINMARIRLAESPDMAIKFQRIKNHFGDTNAI